jgi:hypothetical protein
VKKNKKMARLAEVAFYFGLIVLSFIATWHFGAVP